MSSYIPLNNYTHHSLLLGLSKHKEIANRCMQIGAKSCAITDNGTISGCVSFYKEMINNDIKPILGCELNIYENDNISKLILLCKNLNAWKNLIKIVSITNSKEFYDKKPRIDLDNLSKLISGDHFICITGYYDSTLWNSLLSNEENAKQHINKLESIFGNNIYIEINKIEQSISDTTKRIQQIASDNKIKTIAGVESYYCNKEDAADQKILLCSNLKTTLPEISKKVLSNIDTGFNRFFNSDNFYIIDNDLAESIYSKEELENTIEIANMCESYSPLSKPILPKFPYPEKYSSESEYLRDLCRQGWKEKIQNIIPQDQQQIYVDRIKHELEVLDGAGLSSYFLIVRDILSFVRSNNWLPGPGRGSAAGCLVSYLIGITNIDPIKYDLLFERFYNAGRNTKDRISMPDIDVDVPITKRDQIIQYIKNKYGQDKVSQMITFNTLKGRGALKEVLRVYGNISFEEMNNITKHIPDESKIADELQEIRDDEGTASIIRWTLENNGDKLKDWCYIDEDNNLAGPLAKRFEQAIRIEGTKYNQSKHAAGVAIAATPLESICPMIFDTKTEQNIAGIEMGDLESLGVIKFDILGIALLDKIMSVNSIINGGNHEI